MTRRLLNTATVLSLLLSLVAAGMWARSQHVTEGWEFNPRPSGMNYQSKGWYRHRLVESAGGRLVYAEYRFFVRGNDPPPVDDFFPPHLRHRMYRPRPSVNPAPPPPPTPGYRETAAPLTPELRGRVPESDPREPPPGSYGRIPGVAEWQIVPRYQRRFIAVSWLAIALTGAVLPSAWATWRWRRWRRLRAPAFPVVPTPAASP